jgi:hypothetical protein
MLLIPQSEEQLYAYLIAITVVYILLRIAILYLRGDSTEFGIDVLNSVFNGITLATSIMLLAGLMDARLLILIGSTKPFLFLSALLGSVFSLWMLFRKS